MADAMPAGGGQRSRRDDPPRRLRAYVGTYSSPEGPEGYRGNGRGIYLFEMDAETGGLIERDVFETATNPSWIYLNPAGTHLYAVGEIDNFNHTNSGSVNAFAIAPDTGRLTALSTVSSEGSGPAYLSVHPSGRYVLVANYAGGTSSVIPIRPDGSLGPATDVKHDHGTPGNQHPSSAPPGSFAISGHDAPHPHMIRSDPHGRYVIQTDLGLDRIYVWRLDLDTGKLHPNEPHSVSLPSGDGPRHFVFHPTRHWMYSLQEEASTIAHFDYEPERGTLSLRKTVSLLPPGFAGTNFGSEVRISKDGRFLYSAGRLHDSISCFRIGEDGALSFVGDEWTRGDYPRSFNFDPDEKFVYSCNQRADAVTIFRRDAESGRLESTGRYVAVGTPASILFAR
jgi:6-phosphogluconolactonase